jgi:biopolymer transport protein ExbD
MRLHRPRKREMPENTIPLINVVFLLLIFFMLAGRLSQPEPFGVTPPQSASQQQPGEQDTVVYVGADGTLALGREKLPLSELPGALAAARGESDQPVRLKADAEAEANRVIRVMETLKKAGITQVVVLTKPADGG